MNVIDLNLRRVSSGQLADSAKAGSDPAFQELARRLNGYMRYRERELFMPGSERQDLHQEALVGLHKAVQSYREGRGDFEALARLCIDRQLITAVKTATRGKHKILSHRVVGDEADAAAEEPISPGLVHAYLDPKSDPLDLLCTREELTALRRVVNEDLTEVEREAITGWASGLGYDAIAEFTGRSVKTIDNALQRSRRKLSEGMAAAA